MVFRRYSYAECITTPFLRRALVNLDAHRGLNVLDLARAKGLQRLSAWMVVGHPRAHLTKTYLPYNNCKAHKVP